MATITTTDTRISDISSRLAAIDTSTTTTTTTSSKTDSLLSSGTVGTMQMLNPTPITNPNMLYSSIELSSYDNTDPNNRVLLSESFDITFGNITPVKLSGIGGNVWYLQFGTSNYGVKFHLPYGTNYNKMFITYCVKDSNYAGGHRDYTTTIEQAWIDAALTYCNKLPPNTTSTIGATRSFSVSTFPTYNSRAWFFYFKGTGVSSSVNTQGSFSVSLSFLGKEVSEDSSSIAISK